MDFDGSAVLINSVFEPVVNPKTGKATSKSYIYLITRAHMQWRILAARFSRDLNIRRHLLKAPLGSGE